jgi:WbqC-like protein family
MKNKKLVVIQSNYIPWKGYFDLINSADEFIIYDHVQYTKNDWRNRNRLKSKEGLIWLTIPILSKGKFGQSIAETQTKDTSWPDKHFKTFTSLYSHAPFFATYRSIFEELYEQCKQERLLSIINGLFIFKICECLSIKTKITPSSSYINIDGPTENLINLCKQAGATEYISGPSARDYIDQSQFERAGIQLTFIDYSNYPEYHQRWAPFRHDVSILDLILNEGPDAWKFMKSFSKEKTSL